MVAVEAAALAALRERIGESFNRACELLLAAQGRVIVAGMGKSGHIAGKLAASLSSTGTAAHFLHAAEAAHGDLGVVTPGDVLVALSYSGETQEIVELVDRAGQRSVPVISITASGGSSLGRRSTCCIELGQVSEADPYNLVPSTSALLTLAVGDALAISLMQARGFTSEDFASYHPKGNLGKRLTLQVRDLLRGAETNPVVREDQSLEDALAVITQHTLGGTCVAGADGKLVGLLTDGDIRRLLSRLAGEGVQLAEAMKYAVGSLMTRAPLSALDSCLAYEAMAMMEEHKPRPVFVLPIINSARQPVGLLHLHALVQAGFKSTNGPSDP